MTKVIDVRIQTTADLKGTQEIERALARLMQAQRQGGGDSGAAGIDKLAVASARAATEQQKLATEVQRTTTATNQAATAAQRLATEEQRTATATAQASAAKTRAEQAALRYAQAQEKAARATQQTGQGMAVLPRTIAGLSHEAATAATAMLGVGTALAVVAKGAELAQLGAQAALVETRFQGMAAAAGQSGNAILAALRAASGGEIADLNLQLAANKAALLGVATSADQLSVLMEIARDRAQALGISTEFAFDSIVTGLGRGSALILDNIGITVEAGEVNEAYAASIGKTVSQLTEAEKKQALINAVVAQGSATLAATGGAAESAAGDFAALSASAQNAQTGVGKLIAELLRVPAQVTTEILVKTAGNIDQLNNLDENLKATEARILEVSASYETYGQKVAFVNEQFARELGPGIAKVGEMTELQYNFAQSLIRSGASAEEAMAKVREYGTVIQAGAVANTDWGQSSDVLVNQMLALASTSDGNRAAVENLSAAFLAGNIDAQTLQSALAMLTAQHDAAQQAAFQEEREQRMLTGAHYEGAAATDAATIASMADAAAKEQQAAQTALLTAQTQAAVDEFLLLNPNMDASQAASAAAAAGLSPLIQQLIVAAIKAREARNELAAFNAMAGIKAAARGSGISDRGAIEELKQDQLRARVAANQATAAKRYNDMLEAQRQRINAVGSAQERVTLAEQDLAAARKQYGANSAQAYKAETALMQARERSEKAAKGAGGGRAGGGAGGGGARASQAEQTTSRLADIERSGGNKIAEINEQTQQKLTAIEKKYAEQRAAQQRQLMDDIARANASTAFDQQLNDFDQFQKDLSDEQKAALQAREEAEQDYNAKVAAAQEDARAEAANGDAQLAEDILAARTKQAEQEKQIAEEAAKARAAGADAGAVAREAQEATEAAQQQADTEIAIARAKAQERAGAEQAEKDAVIAAAEEQKNKVVAAAEEQASKVKGASDSQKNTVISNLQAQASAAKAWADSVVADAQRVQDAYNNSGGPPAPEGGGEGGGDGGDPGGGPTIAGARPLGKGAAGATTGGDVIGAIQDVINFLAVLLPTITAHNKLIKEVRTYQHALQNTVTVIGRIVELRKTLAQPIPPLNTGAIVQIAEDAKFITGTVAQHIDKYAQRNARLFEHILAADKAAIAVLEEIIDLRGKLTGATLLPINMALVQKLAAESKTVVEIVKNEVLGANRAMSKDLEQWAKLVGDSVGIIKDVADLPDILSKAQPPITPGSIRKLAELAKQTTMVVQAFLVPLSEEQAKSLSDYASAAQGAIAIIKDVAELPETLGKVQPPIPPGSIKKLAVLARQVLLVVEAYLVPTAEETAEQVSRYADAAGSAISLIKDTLGLTSDLFTDYKSPTNAQIGMIVKDADRLVKAVNAAASLYKTDGLEATKAYGDALGSVLGAFKDQLLFAQAIGSGDFVLDPKKLTQFEQGSRAIMAVAGRLAAQAATIPPGNITALQNVTSALTGQAEMLIKMSAVPFGNLPTTAANYGASGGGMGGNTVINVYGAQGQDVNALANIVMQKMSQRVGARR